MPTDDSVAQESGLHQKYEVNKDGEPVEDCFVLEPESDEAALAALKEYALETDNHFLAADLADWIAEIDGVQEGANDA